MKGSSKPGKSLSAPLIQPEKAVELEKCMVKHNLKLTKSDITLAARRTNVPISKALLHFQSLKKELKKNKMVKCKELVEIVKGLSKRITKLKKRVQKQEENA